MDTVSRAKRSEIMRAIKSRDTGPEREVARALRRWAPGWRRQYAVLGFRPDFVWPKEKVALFVDGCFWHGHPGCWSCPKTNSRWWRNKIRRNRARDRRQGRALLAAGWTLRRIYECHIRTLGGAFAAMLVEGPVERARDLLGHRAVPEATA